MGAAGDGAGGPGRGDTPLDVEIRFPVEPERYPQVSPGFTAHPAVNAVPDVCEAAPGIRTTFDLPRVVPHLADWR